MMSRQGILRLAMGLALATATTTSWAEGSNGFYFGVTGGQSQADLSKDELDDIVLDSFAVAGAPVLTATSDLEDKDTSFSLFGGYRFSEYFALEAGYVDFGTSEYRASGTVNPPGPTASAPATYAADFEVKGFSVAALGAIPLGEKFNLHAQLGILFADTEITQAASVSTTFASESFSANSQDVFYGVGAAFHLGANWTFSLDWQTFKDVGDDEETGESDVDRISLGVIYRL